MTTSESTHTNADTAAAVPREIRGEAILAWIRQPGMRPFRYQLNAGGVAFFVLIALGLLVASALYYRFHRQEAGIWLSASVIAAFGLWFLWVGVHWMFFAARNYLGLTDNELLVGRGARAVVIPLEHLTREAIDASRMRVSALTTVLPIRMNGVFVRIHIHGPFAVLKDHTQFLTGVLCHLIEPASEQDAADPDDSPGEGGTA